MTEQEDYDTFWSSQEATLLEQNAVDPATGLSEAEARRRLSRYGANTIRAGRSRSVLRLFLQQFSGPFMILLLLTDGLSFILGESVDALIIFFLILLSGLLSFWQEKGAGDVMERLLAIVRTRATVLRDGSIRQVDEEEVVPGEVLKLSAGDLIPADCRILESRDLFINEAALTGEAFPVSKSPATLPVDTPLRERTNALFKGAHVVSGTATALAISTGRQTVFGRIAERMHAGKGEAAFERGLRRFSYLLMELVLLLTFVIFAINIYFDRPFIEALLFSLALSIGVTPFLLPAIVGVSLAHGARHMADRKVIVKRLAAIENFGSMSVFCSDKTGTLTSGEIRIHSFRDVNGRSDPRIIDYARINALAESGYRNPIDESIRQWKERPEPAFRKLDEVPFDFIRKRLSILAEVGNETLLLTKGAFHNLLDVCASVAEETSVLPLDDSRRQALMTDFETFSRQGYRVIGIAFRSVEQERVSRDDEQNMTFLGMILFHDPPKPDIVASVTRMRELGIRLKILSGDSRFVTGHLGQLLGLGEKVLVGTDLNQLPDPALRELVKTVDLFAELEPSQKERLVRLLALGGEVVGYIGDGINDVASLHVADVGISVDNAVDVARSTADIVLLERNLEVLLDGILEGRRTFINSLKYTFMTTSANFGNVVSMAIASLFLPFLPLLPKQILATQFISDLPAMTIPSDNVDEEWMRRPRRWDLAFIKRFMITFGLLSTIFDLLTFAVLLGVLHTSTSEFRSGWFLVTVLTEFVVLWVLRSRRPFFRSRPGRPMLFTTLAMFILVCLVPYTPLGPLLELQRIPVHHFWVLLLIVGLYALANEWMKRLFYRKVAL